MRETLIDIQRALELRIYREQNLSLFCSSCQHTGKVYGIQSNVIIFDYCQCYLEIKHRREYPEKLQASRIPRTYWDKELKDFVNMGSDKSQIEHNSKTIIEINNLASNIFDLVKLGNNILIQGHKGTGKTLISCLLGKYAILKGLNVAFAEYPLMCSWVLSNDGDDYKRKFIDFARSADLLILDGIDKFKSKIELSVSLFDGMVSTRVMNKRSNIFTSNESFKQLKTTIGETGQGLILERGKILSLIGKDFRA